MTDAIRSETAQSRISGGTVNWLIQFNLKRSVRHVSPLYENELFVGIRRAC